MKKIKCISDTTYQNFLSKDMVYDVVIYLADDTYTFCDSVVIYVGNRECAFYFYDDYNKPIFKDVTEEYRNDIIDGILK